LEQSPVYSLFLNFDREKKPLNPDKLIQRFAHTHTMYILVGIKYQSINHISQYTLHYK